MIFLIFLNKTDSSSLSVFTSVTRNSHILREKSYSPSRLKTRLKTGGCCKEEEKGVALPHVLHPLEEADVISTLNQQSARAVGEAPRGEKSIKCPTNDVAFLLPLFFTLRPRYSPSRPVYIPGTPSGALSVPMHWFSLVTDFKPFVGGSKHIWQPSGIMIMQRYVFPRDRTTI